MVASPRALSRRRSTTCLNVWTGSIHMGHGQTGRSHRHRGRPGVTEKIEPPHGLVGTATPSLHQPLSSLEQPVPICRLLGEQTDVAIGCGLNRHLKRAAIDCKRVRPRVVKPPCLLSGVEAGVGTTPWSDAAPTSRRPPARDGRSDSLPATPACDPRQSRSIHIDRGSRQRSLSFGGLGRCMSSTPALRQRDVVKSSYR